MNRKLTSVFFAFFVMALLSSTQIGAQDKAARDRLFAAHADFYSEPIAANEGVLVTRLAV